jgi:predicted TIM-barrel fold metal-dependent hydrolase
MDAGILSDIRVIDTDTHITEPYDLWTSRMSVQKWGDKVPHVIWDETRQCEVWVAGDELLWIAAGVAHAGHDKPHPDFPKRWVDLNPEVWRAEDRLDLMTRYGIYAAVLYPNVPGFGAGRFRNVGGDGGELALELIRAYNDFLIDFSSADKKRFIPIMAVPFWDLEASLKEIERAASLGHRGIIFSQEPQGFGCPLLADRHWDPIWAKCQEMGLSVNFHIGSGAIANNFQDNYLLPASEGIHVNAALFPALMFMGNARAIASVIGGGICHRFPDLKFVSVESGIGWIPFALQALDWMWNESAVSKEHPEYDLLPSEYFRRQIYGCFWFERGETLAAAIDFLGDERVLYETDFPHPAGMSPGPASHSVPPIEFITDNLLNLPEQTLRRVLHDNAAALYKID